MYRHGDLQPRDLGPSFASTLRHTEIWGASLGQFCAAYAFYFVISWLPLYLVKSRGLSVGQMAEIGGLIYLVYAASSYSVGWLSDQWIRIAASLIAAAIGDLTVAVISLFCAGVAFGFTSPNFFVIGQTLAGPRAAGKWVGIQNCVGNLAGIIAPIITGL